MTMQRININPVVALRLWNEEIYSSSDIDDSSKR